MSSPGKPGPSLTFEQQDALEELRAVLRAELPIEEGGYRLSAAKTPAEVLEGWENQPGPVLFFQQSLHLLLRLEPLAEGGENAVEQIPLPLVERLEQLAEAPTRLRALLTCARDVMRGRDALVASEGYAPSVLAALHGASWQAGKKLGGKQKPAEAWVEAMRKTRDVGQFVVPPAMEPEVMASAVARVKTWVEENNPFVQLPLVELRAVEASPGWGETATEPSLVQVVRSGLTITMQLLIYELSGDQRQVRDIKEQQVFVVPRDWLSDVTRCLACLTAWTRMLPAHLATRENDEIETQMPHDLVDLSPLKLKRPQSVQEFCEVYARRWKVELPEA